MAPRQTGAVVALRHCDEWEWLSASASPGGRLAPCLRCDFNDDPDACLWEIDTSGGSAGEYGESGVATGTGTGTSVVRLLHGAARVPLSADGATRFEVQNLGDGTCALKSGARYLDACVDGCCLADGPVRWCVTVKDIPCLSVADVVGGDDVPAAVLRRVGRSIVEAASQVGFFALTGHGLDAEIEALLSAARRGVGEMRCGDGEGARGFSKATLMSATGYVQKSATGPRVRAAPPAWWSHEDASAVAAYYAEACRVAEAVLRCVAAALEVDLAEGGTRDCVLCMMTYRPSSDGGVTLAEHTDKDWLTLLLQDGTDGLEVEGRDPTDWLAVKGSLQVVVNIGDALQAVSGGRLKSKVHRARAPPTGVRVSFPLFVEPTLWPETAVAQGARYVVRVLS